MANEDEVQKAMEELEQVVEEADPNPREAHCYRSGQCCRFILIDSSPRQLRRDYADWNYNPNLKYSEAKAIHFDEIHLIYPMLSGRCRGKWKNPYCKTIRYVYGPCSHLHSKDDTPACTIYEIRPRMCRAYPYYGKLELEMSVSAQEVNPSYMKGCGFNTNSEVGFSAEEIMAGLTPLDDDEKE